MGGNTRGEPREDGSFGPAESWNKLRQWDASKHRAFEELCFQLRESAPEGYKTVKTGNPDGGVEWYSVGVDLRVLGFQAKFVDTVDRLLPLAKESLTTVAANRRHRNVVELTFYAPFDMPDQAPTVRKKSKKPIKSARQRWDEAKARWRTEIVGADDIEVHFVGGGELLERLTLPGNEGRYWFFFNELFLGPEWCRQQLRRTIMAADDRYTPEHNVDLPLALVFEGLTLAEGYRRRLSDRAIATRQQTREAIGVFESWVDRFASEARDVWAATATQEPFDGRLSTLVELTRSCSQHADLLTTKLSDLLPDTELPLADLATIANELYDSISSYFDALKSLSERLAAIWPSTELSETEDAGPPRARERRLTPAEGLSGSLVEGIRIRARRAINELLETLGDEASRAAEAGAWLLSGPAGQGKTHTMLDAAEKAIERGGLAAVVLGEQMRDEDPLTEVGRRLGLGDLGHDVLLQALDAAGAASSAKFLLAIDAVNDTQDPMRWRTDLGPLLAQLADYPHVALALSCRETLLAVIMPPNLGNLSLPRTWHPGFGGREVEALERYLRDVPYILPRVPLLLPTFSNPLFVKLYAENLRRKAELLGRSASVQVNGTQHRTEVFEGFLDARAAIICKQLHLDPAARPVHQAVAAIAARMGETGVEVVEREEARKIVDAFAPHRNKWPDTMLGKLVAHGLLTTERYYRLSKSSVGVAFPYQAFSDDRVLRSLLAAHHGDVSELRAGRTIAAEAGLRRALEAASPNIREAATILLPELAGAELIDVLGLDLRPTRASSDGPDPLRILLHALVSTLPQRAASSVTERTVELINTALRQFNMHQQVLTAALAISTEPEHILNAERLHTVLLRLTRAERDAWWTIDTYDWLDSPTPLHRLIRWAEQLPTPQRLIPGKGSAVPKLRARRAGLRVEPQMTTSEPPAEVVRLGALTLCWALASSNRFLRDRATKALVQLLLGYPDVIIELVDRFLHLDGDRVDDPYIFERLVLASYGFVLRVGHAYPDEVGKIARKILDYVYGDVGRPAHASRSALLCDAARNVVEAAVRMGVLDEDAAQRVQHPHPANRPGAAPTKQQLEQRVNGDTWLPLTLSLHTQGDFGAYEVEPAIGKISKLPASRPRPAPRDQRREHMPVVVEARRRQFRNALPDAAKNTFGSRQGVLMLLSNTWVAQKLLSEVQLELLAACRKPPSEDETLIDTRHEADWANRWILARVRSLGWRPDRFGDFDRFHGRGRGREAHKAERIGKKYQWLGLFELGERLTNHYHLNSHFDDEPDPVAAWQLDLRDLDPSLPPAPHPFANDTTDESKIDDDHALATFAWADRGPWMPPVPDLPAMQELQQWIENGENLPDLHQVGHRSLPSDTRRWIVLDEFVSDTPDGRGFGGKKRQPEQWHHINSWLVDLGQLESMLTFIETRSLVPRWMPDGRQPHGIYLGEFPHAYAARDPYDGTPEEHHDLSYTDHYTMQDSAPPDEARQSISKLLRSDLDQDAKMSAFWDWWSSPSGDDSEASFDDDELDDLLDAYRGGSILSPFERHHRAAPKVDDGVDEQGNPLRALPATQDFSWPATGADCSLEANVNGTLPTNILLADTSLTRHPDKLEWFDENGSLVITFMRGRRDTGAVRTLLACEDWLIRRLATLNRALVIGLFGERQQVTETPTIWSTFSQPAGLNPTTGKLHVKNTITRLQRRAKD